MATPGSCSATPGARAGRGSSRRRAIPACSQQLGLDSDSRVVIVATEGATDPEVYRQIVGSSPDEVEGG